jgi:hypothetical protein
MLLRYCTVAAGTPVYEIGFKLEVREPAAHWPWYRELYATL